MPRHAESPWNHSYKAGDPTKTKKGNKEKKAATPEDERDARAAEKRRRLDRIIDARRAEAALREIWD